MSEVIRMMKRVGTFGNYFRITDNNRNLLRNGKMCEVDVQMVDGKLKEVGVSNRDISGSQKTAPIIAEILEMDKRRAILVAAVAKRNGGDQALANAGLEVPEQTIHDTAASRKIENDAKQVAKTKANNKAASEARTRIRKEAKKPVDPVVTPDPIVFDEDI